MRLARLYPAVRTFWSDRDHLIRRWLVALAIGTLSAWIVWQIVSRPTVVTIAVGPAGSEHVTFLKSVAQRMKQAGKPVRLKVVEVADHATALSRYTASKVDLAVLRSDQAAVADARSFAIVDRRAVLLVTIADPPPTKSVAAGKPTDKSSDDDEGAAAAPGPLSPTRLIGRRIVVVRDEGGLNLAVTKRLLAHAGLDDANASFSEIAAEKVAAAVAARQADVVVLVVDPATERTRRLIGALEQAFGGPLSIGSPPSSEALAVLMREVSAIEMQAGMLRGGAALPPTKMTTVAVTEEIIGGSDIDEAVGAQLLKSLLEVRGRLGAEPFTGFEIEAPPLDTQRRFMPHAGVSAHINDRSTTFLEKYSDQIWLALFGLGLIGSSIASFAGRLGLVGRKAPVDPLPGDVERVLGAIAAAGSIAEIDQVRRELRALAAQRLRRAVAEGLDASDARHPSQWFPLIDALAASRRDELGTAAPPASHPIRAA